METGKTRLSDAKDFGRHAKRDIATVYTAPVALLQRGAIDSR